MWRRRKCIICKKELPADSHAGRKMCFTEECRSEYIKQKCREWRKNNKEHKRAYWKAYRLKMKKASEKLKKEKAKKEKEVVTA